MLTFGTCRAVYGALLSQVGGMLACDPFEETSLGSQSYLTTVCPQSALGGEAAVGEGKPSMVPARTAFTVVKVTDPRLKVVEDDKTSVDSSKEDIRAYICTQYYFPVNLG